MTPSDRLHHNQRLWTPRLLSATTALSAGAVVLWFFVSNWILDIKTATNSIQMSINSMSIQYEGRFAKLETTIGDHEMRLAKLEEGKS